MKYAIFPLCLFLAVWDARSEAKIIIDSDFTKENPSDLSEWKGLAAGLQSGEARYGKEGLSIEALKPTGDCYFKLSLESVDLPPEYTVQFRVIPQAYQENNSGHFGVSIDGIKVVIRSELIIFTDETGVELEANRLIRGEAISGGAAVGSETVVAIRNRKEEIEVLIDGDLYATIRKSDAYVPEFHLYVWNSNAILESISIAE